VTKLVKHRVPEEGNSLIERIFMPKYPYEYLRDAAKLREGDPSEGVPSRRERILTFYQGE
jgi:hypothetical protein